MHSCVRFRRGISAGGAIVFLALPLLASSARCSGNLKGIEGRGDHAFRSDQIVGPPDCFHVPAVHRQTGMMVDIFRQGKFFDHLNTAEPLV